MLESKEYDFLSLLNKFRWFSPLCREQGSRRHRHCYLRIAICCVYLLIQDMKSMPKMPQFLGKTTVRIELSIHSKTKVSNSITFSFIFFETKSKLHVFLSNFYLNFIFILFHTFISWYKSRAKDRPIRPCIGHEINAKNTQFLGKTIMVIIGLCTCCICANPFPDPIQTKLCHLIYYPCLEGIRQKLSGKEIGSWFTCANLALVQWAGTT